MAALDLWAQAGLKEHHGCGLTALNAAIAYLSVGYMSNALSLAETAFACLGPALGPRHPSTLDALGIIERHRERKNDWRAAALTRLQSVQERYSVNSPEYEDAALNALDDLLHGNDARALDLVSHLVSEGCCEGKRRLRFAGLAAMSHILLGDQKQGMAFLEEAIGLAERENAGFEDRLVVFWFAGCFHALLGSAGISFVLLCRSIQMKLEVRAPVLATHSGEDRDAIILQLLKEAEFVTAMFFERRNELPRESGCELIKLVLRLHVAERLSLVLQKGVGLSPDRRAEMEEVDKILQEASVLNPIDTGVRISQEALARLWTKRSATIDTAADSSALSSLRSILSTNPLDDLVAEIGSNGAALFPVSFNRLKEMDATQMRDELRYRVGIGRKVGDHFLALARSSPQWGCILMTIEDGEVVTESDTLGDALDIEGEVLAIQLYLQDELTASGARSVPKKIREFFDIWTGVEARRADMVKRIRSKAIDALEIDKRRQMGRIKPVIEKYASFADALEGLRLRFNFVRRKQLAGTRLGVLQVGPLLSLPFDMVLMDGPLGLGNSPDIFYYAPAQKAVDRFRERDRIECANSSAQSGSVIVFAPEFDYYDGERCVSDEILDRILTKTSVVASSALQITHFEKLPGTTMEALAIEEINGARLLSGIDATKANVLCTTSPEVLHFATHAFVLNKDAGKGKELGVLPFGAVSHAESAGYYLGPVLDPYLRSGLALAGANWRWTMSMPGSGAGDGVLWAREVLWMDLRRTKLVVLSACETAQGEGLSSFGVSSLAEAFLLAGVRTVVASIWRLPDEEGAIFMKDFYGRLYSGYSIVESLKYAKRLAMTRWPRTAAIWANYQCFGDPGLTLRPLSAVS